MFGSKSREIADLKRLLRVQAGKLADTEDDLRATRHTMRTAARLYAAENTTARLHRALKACDGYRQELGRQARVTRRLADSLLDATGSRGSYLLPVERDVLGLTDKETP